MAKYEDYEKEYQNCIILQLRGMFFNAFGDSAKLLSYLLGFKLNKSDTGLLKAGFPTSSENKVKNILKQHHINYVFLTNGVATGKCFFDDNEYMNVLKSCPDLSDAKKADSDMSTNMVPSNNVTDKKNVSDPDLVRFMSLICEGKNPFTGDDCNFIDLEDVKMIRMFYKIRDALMNI